MKRCFLLFSIIFWGFTTFGQTQNFENEILAFEKKDSIQMPEKGANLFVGSSSFRFWVSLEKDFEGFKVINRGFGGSTLLDLEKYTSRIITKYEPAKIFIYSGENDIAEGTPASETFNRFTKAFLRIRAENPNTPIVYVSMKPSILRWQQFDAQKKANKLIKNFLKGESNTRFVNIVNKMMVKGEPNPTLYVADKLHMNKNGYKIWTKKLKRYLVIQ